MTEPYCYFTGQRYGQLEHLLDLNWVYVWLINKLKSWEQMHCFQYELPLKILQPDALCGIWNTITKRMKFYFLEMDRSKNHFDKVEKYNRWYEADGYIGQWWLDQTDRFPVILVVTLTTRRKEKIMEKIAKENTNGLEFKVMLLSEIKGGRYDNNWFLCEGQ
ncbi:hypothetical protein Desru_0710 [Desulforamulus ruminis DSM 2154]|uniref:Uncharacterized protein n=2 Tax=Desulforamulus ruminis TaxID=1564 RepID=F6DTX6_DESRL|nr:hypothetical protein Desru_0710 [Desulforamulus ruminis DSM 2154]